MIYSSKIFGVAKKMILTHSYEVIAYIRGHYRLNIYYFCTFLEPSALKASTEAIFETIVREFVSS